MRVIRYSMVKKQMVGAFTMLEMLMVLLIISVLMLLFVPNLSKQKDKVTETGNAAVTKVVENQAEIYEMSQGTKPTLSQLVASGSITDKQKQAYKDYYAKHEKGSQALAD
ncbi:competence type IV pilus major pilin ComGC [Streptococcus phocae subsp. phocae]